MIFVDVALVSNSRTAALRNREREQELNEPITTKDDIPTGPQYD